MAGKIKAGLLASVAPFAVFAAGTAHAQTAPKAASTQGTQVEQIVVTGVRGQPRSVQDSPVPVDVLSAKAIQKVSQSDTLNTLQTLIPSFTVTRSPNTTANTFIRSPSLRGLPADETLLLLNGIRRHKSASVGVSGNGSQSADAAVIPDIALKSVQVLRDGAAAEYGSDAIAGVINFILKDNRDGGELVAQAGQYYAGDGQDYKIAGNIGLPLTSAGFLSLSGEYTKNEFTDRARQFIATNFNPFTYALSHPDYAAAVDLGTPLQPSGEPKQDALRFVANAGVNLDDNSQLYAFGNFSRSRGTAHANYRYPGGGQPVMDNPIRLQDGSIFRFNQEFPGGLQPDFSGNVLDWSVVGGYKTERDLDGDRKVTANLSARYGWDKIGYSIVSTLNPSMGPTSPTSFRASNYVEDEAALNADFSYQTPVSAFASPLVLSAGAEARREGFEIRPGEPSSYAAGAWSAPDPFGFCTRQSSFSQRTLTAAAPNGAGIDCTNPKDPVYNTLSVGSNGITGLPPQNTGSWNTNSYSGYLEASTDVTSRWFVDLATRYEDYDGVGSKVIGKVATRFKLTDDWAIRGSVGTGFRAPTAGQVHMTQVAILTVNGVPTNTGLYSADNPVAKFLGAKPLRPETSMDYTVGVTGQPLPNLQLTLDAYHIKVSDQLYSTKQIAVTPAILAAMQAAGIQGAESIASINFFQNAFDSTVEGIDFVGSYRHDWSNGQSTTVEESVNYNKYKIDQVHIGGLFSDALIFNFEHNNPEWREVLTVMHEAGPWTGLVRANVYGPYSRATTAGPYLTEHDHAVAMFDAELEYRFRPGLSLAVGGQNIFDRYPDKNHINATNGAVYADGAVPWQGGFYYARITYGF